ncbi:sensor histidine kinase [Streptomyces mexicanus]|jgi:signal transduction histidine kinase|uniref:histidine kinase n=1 Tax=Streptomyces mexicanus TaxID=178566 RepID=A0A7X1I6X1_9ACTN|nr:sensor histidine kinase [Streptomyces mexicanus]MBC2869899.1 sensor histidine kinase [Streptomyces mexicanus]
MRIHPLAVDGLTALAPTTVACLLGAEAATQGWPPLDAFGWTLVALTNLPLVLRGRAPVGVFLFVHGCWTLYVWLGHWPVVNSPAAMVALYTVAAARPTRITAVCAALLGGVWIYAGVHSDSDAMPSVVGQAIGYPLVIWRFGYAARRTAELTERLRAEQAERARREVAEERVRIARELHDVVAHHMAVINVQAGLARFVFDSDPRTAREALTTIGTTSGEALAELRRMLGLLRADGVAGADGGPDRGGPDGARGAAGEGGAVLEPAPGLDRLEEMVERVRAGGVPVDLTVRGEPRPLPSGVQLCVYRVVQEALTNVLKHAPGAHATVRLVYRAGEIEASVTDDGGAGERGKEVDPDRMPKPGGHGLIGMRERAKLYGGTIVVGPRREGGFGVHLTLPTSEQAARRKDAVTE